MAKGDTFGEACEGKRHFDCGGFVSYCYHQACPEVKYPGPASALLTDASGFRKVEKNEPLIKSGALQAKLRVGAPGNVYEQEADMVAEQVMRMPAPAAQKSDISRARMHSGAVAGQSARNMTAFPGISSMLLSSLLLQRFAGPEIPLTAGQVAAFRSLAHEVAILIRSGALVAEETAAISTAVAEAETAIVATESVITTVVTATTAAEGATVATAALAVDDVTIIGAADDVALPFTIIAAAVGFGVGFGVGYIYRNEIAAAAEKVGRAVNIMRRILANHDVAPNPNTQQQTRTETQTQTMEREKRRKNCFEYNPGAVPCDEPVYDGNDIRDEIVAEWLMQNGYDFSDLVNCSQFGSPIGAGEIEDCGKAPAIRYHCQIKGTRNVVSIFACLCCDVEGNSRFQWSRPHWSINQSRRSQ